MPYTGQLRAAGLAKEVTAGTLVTPPTEYLPYQAPDSFFPTIGLLESTAIRALPDHVYKASQGPGEVKGLKAKWEAEPENIGNLLMAAFGTDTKTGALSTGYTHTFTRLAAAQLPTYSWWFDKGVKFPQFTGCMLTKLDIVSKAKEFVEVDTDWVGLGYDDTGTSKSPTYSALKPWKFDQVTVNVDGSQILNYDNIKISLDNMVKADHVLSGSIYPGKIYSEGFGVQVTMDFIAEDATQYQKFLNGNTAALNFVFTSSQDITGATAGTKNKLTLDIPTVMYSGASFPNAKGLLKIAFTAKGIYTTGSTKTISAALINSVSTAY